MAEPRLQRLQGWASSLDTPVLLPPRPPGQGAARHCSRGTHLVRGVLGVRLPRASAAGEVPGADVAEVDLALGGGPTPGLPAHNDGTARQHLRGERGVTGGSPALARGDAERTDRQTSRDGSFSRHGKLGTTSPGLAESGAAQVSSLETQDGAELCTSIVTAAPAKHPVPSFGADTGRVTAPSSDKSTPMEKTAGRIPKNNCTSPPRTHLNYSNRHHPTLQNTPDFGFLSPYETPGHPHASHSVSGTGSSSSRQAGLWARPSERAGDRPVPVLTGAGSPRAGSLPPERSRKHPRLGLPHVPWLGAHRNPRGAPSASQSQRIRPLSQRQGHRAAPKRAPRHRGSGCTVAETGTPRKPLGIELKLSLSCAQRDPTAKAQCSLLKDLEVPSL